jgi:uncharacterized Zn-binding protein involved in type VI secretion
VAIPPSVVGQAGSTAATAANNAASMQKNPDSHWYDVWTETGSGAAGHASSGDIEYLATHANPTAAALDSAAHTVAALGRDWNSTSMDGLKAGMGQQASALADQAKALFHAGDNPNAIPKGVLGHIGAAFGLLTSLEQLITMPFGMIPFPALPAVRILDQDIGLPHAHNHPPNLIPPAPPVPLPSTGPIIPIPFLSGASTVLINGMPAARCGDMGLGIWCGGFFPMYEVFLGSCNVWVEGTRAGRVGVDITKHCVFSAPKPSDPPMGPMFGATISSSANVMIGGVPLPSLTSMAMAWVFKQLFKGLGKLVGWLRGKFGKGVRVPPFPEAGGPHPARLPPPHGNFPDIFSDRVKNWANKFGEGDRIPITSINAGEMRALTAMTGKECAVVVDANGKLVLVMGIKGEVPMEVGDQLLVHTHPPGGTAYPSGIRGDGNGDLANAAYNQKQYGWDHPQAVIGQDGNVRYFNKDGVISNPSNAALPIDNNGNINGYHSPGGDPNASGAAVPPAMANP